MSQTVKQLDHIHITPTNPKEFYIFLNESLGLPIAWRYRDGRSGGIFAGNTIFEIFERRSGSKESIVGLVFEPLEATDELVHKLSMMDILYYTKSYSGWTNIWIGLLDNNRHSVFYWFRYKDIFES